MRYQLHCPKCHHEFSYDNEYYDKNIARLGVEIRDIQLQIREHNMLPWPEKKARTDWWLRAKKSLTEKQKEIAELKAFRKVADQQLRYYEYHIFKGLVKERLGEKEWLELIRKANEELEAYKVSGLMWHEYTRSNAKADVTSINKL